MLSLSLSLSLSLFSLVVLDEATETDSEDNAELRLDVDTVFYLCISLL